MTRAKDVVMNISFKRKLWEGNMNMLFVVLPMSCGFVVLVIWLVATHFSGVPSFSTSVRYKMKSYQFCNLMTVTTHMLGIIGSLYMYIFFTMWPGCAVLAKFMRRVIKHTNNCQNGLRKGYFIK